MSEEFVFKPDDWVLTIELWPDGIEFCVRPVHLEEGWCVPTPVPPNDRMVAIGLERALIHLRGKEELAGLLEEVMARSQRQQEAEPVLF